MELVSLTEFIVKSLVKDSDLIKINISEEGNFKIIQILASADDIGRLVGKSGMIANAIRTIVQASSYHNKLGKVRINIDTL